METFARILIISMVAFDCFLQFSNQDLLRQNLHKNYSDLQLMSQAFVWIPWPSIYNYTEVSLFMWIYTKFILSLTNAPLLLFFFLAETIANPSKMVLVLALIFYSFLKQPK